MKDADKLREALRAFADRRCISMRRMSQQGGMSPSAVTNFLNGHAKVLTNNTLRRLAAGHGVTVDQLTGAAPDPGPYPDYTEDMSIRGEDHNHLTLEGRLARIEQRLEKLMRHLGVTP